MAKHHTPSIPYQDCKRRIEAVALMKLLSFSVDDIAEGRVMDSSSLKWELTERKRVAKEKQSPTNNIQQD